VNRSKRIHHPAAFTLHCFLQHVLPKGFQRVRHYGWLGAAAAKRERIAALLDRRAPLPPTETLTTPPPTCPACGKVMCLIGELARQPPRVGRLKVERGALRETCAGGNASGRADGRSVHTPRAGGGKAGATVSVHAGGRATAAGIRGGRTACHRRDAGPGACARVLR
jgi:hypothetical protein